MLTLNLWLALDISQVALCGTLSVISWMPPICRLCSLSAIFGWIARRILSTALPALVTTSIFFLQSQPVMKKGAANRSIHCYWQQLQQSCGLSQPLCTSLWSSLNQICWRSKGWPTTTPDFCFDNHQRYPSWLSNNPTFSLCRDSCSWLFHIGLCCTLMPHKKYASALRRILCSRRNFLLFFLKSLRGTIAPQVVLLVLPQQFSCPFRTHDSNGERLPLRLSNWVCLWSVCQESSYRSVARKFT